MKNINKLDEMLTCMKKRYIEEGYCNSGAVTPKNNIEREVLNELIEKGFAEKRKCIIASYMLSKEIRIQLVRDYDLCELWKENNQVFHTNSTLLSGEFSLLGINY